LVLVPQNILQIAMMLYKVITNKVIKLLELLLLSLVVMKVIKGIADILFSNVVDRKQLDVR
jgi:hypothetical protein